MPTGVAGPLQSCGMDRQGTWEATSVRDDGWKGKGQPDQSSTWHGTCLMSGARQRQHEGSRNTRYGETISPREAEPGVIVSRAVV